MDLHFDGEIWYWRGPSPFYFVTVPDEGCRAIHEVARTVTYGWGMIPVTVTLGSTTWQTSLFPKDDRYVLPLKVAVRRAEQVDEGDTVAVRVAVGTPSGDPACAEPAASFPVQPARRQPPSAHDQ